MYRRILLFAFTLVGITSVVTQTLFIRELEQIFYGNELCLGVIFAGWLIFSGIGSIIGRKIKKNIFLELQMSFAVVLPLEFFLIHSIKLVLRIGPGELISPVPMILISFTILAPLSLILGLMFVQGCRWWADEAKSDVAGVTRVYILDAIGDMIGGFIFAYLLIHFFSLTTLFIIAVLNLVTGFIVTAITNYKYRLRGPILALCGLCFVGLSLVKNIERFSIKRAYPGYEIINQERSIFGNLVLVKRGSLYSLYQNGILSFTYPTPIVAEETVHFPFLEVRNPQKILLLGGEVELLREILKYPIDEVWWVAIDPTVKSVCQKWIDFSPLEDPRVKVVWQDERMFVKRYEGEKFDVVLVNLGDPKTALANRFYTLDFFKELKKIVNENAVIALSINSNPNYLSSELKRYNGTIYKTLQTVFPQIALVPGDELKLFATQKSDWLTEDPEILKSRLTVPTQYVTEHYIPYEFYPERISYIRGILDDFEPEFLNTDFRPISYYYNIVLTTSYFSQWFKKVFTFLSGIPYRVTFGIIMASVIIFGFIVRPTVLGIGTLGAAGMGSQLCLILAFEVLSGYVYHKIGIITGVFMLGLSLGAKLTEKRPRRLALIMGCAILYLGILILIIKVLAHEVLPGLEILFYLFPVLGGILVGSAWRVANQSLIKQGETAERSSGLLYGVDLLGSCVAVFFLSVFFIPIYGLYSSILLLGSINFVSLVFLLMRKR